MTPEKESVTAASRACIVPQLLTGKKRNVEYKNGARYHGDVCGNRRSGYGHFSWPNGAYYTGEFVDNLRHGEGLPCQVHIEVLLFLKLHVVFDSAKMQLFCSKSLVLYTMCICCSCELLSVNHCQRESLLEVKHVKPCFMIRK